MKSFSSFAGLAAELAAMTVADAKLDQRLLEGAAKMVERRAKQKIGDYQDQAGQFVAWAELAESTKQDRERQGFPEDEPLLRTGDLRDSIEHNSSSSEAHIGSDSDIAVYQELGTETIPPRSFLGGAAFELAPQIATLIGEDYTAHLAGQEVFGGTMRIERE